MSQLFSEHNTKATGYKTNKLVRRNNDVSIEAHDVSTSLSRDELLIKMEIGALCRTDLFVAEGTRGQLSSLTLGHEAAGTVLKAGAWCTLTPGTHVVINPLRGCQHCEYCSNNLIHLCADQEFIGLSQEGCFTQYYTCAESSVFAISETLDWKEASYLEPVAAALAVMEYPYLPSDRVCILGSNRIASLVQQILAAHAIKADVMSLNEQSRSLERSYDVVIETLPQSPGIDRAIALLKPRGTLLLKSRPEQRIPISVNQLLTKEIKVMSCAYGCFQQARSLLEDRRIDVSQYCGKIFPLSEFQEAFATAKNNERYKYFLSLQ